MADDPPRSPPPALAPVEGSTEIQFELTTDDVIEASIALTHRSRSMRLYKIGTGAAVAALVTWMSMTAGVGMFGAVIGVLALSGYLLVSQVIAPRVQREQMNAILKEGRNLYLTGKQRLVFDANHLVVGNWAVETHLRWAAIEQVVTTERHVLLYYGGTRALTIPLSAFGSPEEVERFVALARQLHTTAMRQLTSGSDRR